MSYLADEIYTKDYATSPTGISIPAKSQAHILDIKDDRTNEHVYEVLDKSTGRKASAPQLNTFKARSDEDIAAALRIVSDNAVKKRHQRLKASFTVFNDED
ncbi:hypothetical protein KEM56_001445, partial [Ascosphaera pollenicola]